MDWQWWWTYASLRDLEKQEGGTGDRRGSEELLEELGYRELMESSGGKRRLL